MHAICRHRPTGSGREAPLESLLEANSATFSTESDTGSGSEDSITPSASEESSDSPRSDATQPGTSSVLVHLHRHRLPCNAATSRQKETGPGGFGDCPEGNACVSQEADGETPGAATASGPAPPHDAGGLQGCKAPGSRAGKGTASGDLSF
ncbi:uncharacterized protein LOC144463514 [Epinephelus lanceolatus]